MAHSASIHLFASRAVGFIQSLPSGVASWMLLTENVYFMENQTLIIFVNLSFGIHSMNLTSQVVHFFHNVEIQNMYRAVNCMYFYFLLPFFFFFSSSVFNRWNLYSWSMTLAASSVCSQLHGSARPSPPAWEILPFWRLQAKPSFLRLSCWRQLTCSFSLHIFPVTYAQGNLSEEHYLIKLAALSCSMLRDYWKVINHGPLNC